MVPQLRLAAHVRLASVVDAAGAAVVPEQPLQLPRAATASLPSNP